MHHALWLLQPNVHAWCDAWTTESESRKETLCVLDAVLEVDLEGCFV